MKKEYYYMIGALIVGGVAGFFFARYKFSQLPVAPAVDETTETETLTEPEK